jgi:hypothetical protein
MTAIPLESERFQIIMLLLVERGTFGCVEVEDGASCISTCVRLGTGNVADNPRGFLLGRWMPLAIQRMFCNGKLHCLECLESHKWWLRRWGVPKLQSVNQVTSLSAGFLFWCSIFDKFYATPSPIHTLQMTSHTLVVGAKCSTDQGKRVAFTNLWFRSGDLRCTVFSCKGILASSLIHFQWRDVERCII